MGGLKFRKQKGAEQAPPVAATTVADPAIAAETPAHEAGTNGKAEGAELSLVPPAAPANEPTTEVGRAAELLKTFEEAVANMTAATKELAGLLKAGIKVNVSLDGYVTVEKLDETLEVAGKQIEAEFASINAKLAEMESNLMGFAEAAGLDVTRDEEPTPVPNSDPLNLGI